MAKKRSDQARARQPREPAGRGPGDERAESATPTATALAGEAAATGVLPLAADGRPREIPGDEGERLRAGDPDVREIDSAYVGDTAPGGHMATPDQNGVDDIGRAMGVQEEDGGELHSSSEILDRRDRKRQELQAPGRPPSAYNPER